MIASSRPPYTTGPESILPPIPPPDLDYASVREYKYYLRDMISKWEALPPVFVLDTFMTYILDTFDPEESHKLADEMFLKIASILGYSESVNQFLKSTRWYA